MSDYPEDAYADGATAEYPIPGSGPAESALVDGPPAQYAPVTRGARGGRRRLRNTVITVVVVLGLLVAADFTAKALAENVLASEIKSHGFPKKPDISIQGFPFLTQVATEHFQQIDLSSSDVPEGPVTIKSITAILNGIRLKSGFRGATIDRLTGSVFITFPEISNALMSVAGPLGSVVGNSGMAITAVGRHEIRASVNLLVTSFSATWRITDRGGHSIHARLISSNGLPSGLGGSVGNITVPLSSLPFGLAIRHVSVTPDGITGRLTGRNLSFGS